MAIHTLFALLLCVPATSMKTDHTLTANPIRKVVGMLQAMQKKIVAEADAEEKLFDKFQCYCKNGGSTLGDSIGSAETKIPSLSSDIEAAEAKAVQLKQALKQHQTDRSDAEENLAAAKGLRQKEAASYAGEKSEAEETIATVKAAVAAIEKGMSGSFVQTEVSQNLQRLVLSKQGMLEADRQQVLAFLSGGSDLSQSGEVVGILKEMGESMTKNLAEATAAEEGAVKTYNALVAAKKKEMASLSSSIEDKMQRIGELAVSAVQMKNDLSDTEEALLENKKYLADLDTTCKQKAGEWDERKGTRSEEVAALADTIRILNDDESLELFKQTLPSASASFVQLESSTTSMRKKALSSILALKNPKLDFLVLALRGKKAGFTKVVAMIEAMVATLKGEQKNDNDKREYCAGQAEIIAASSKDLKREVKNAEAAIADTEGAIAATKEAVAALEADIKSLDKTVEEASTQRKEEHAEFESLMASDSAAKELLGIAKNRLNKFYNKALYKEAPKRELSEEDRINVNMGGTVAPTMASGIAGTGVTALAEVSMHRLGDAPPAPPATFGAYSKKTGEATGVLSMLDLLVKDLDKEMQEAAVEEKNSQADYEKMMDDSKAKRAEDGKALNEKSANSAELEGDLMRHSASKDGATQELAATAEYSASLHAECDWLVGNFEVRQEARNSEIDSLGNAKAILSGADYSF